MKKFFLPVLLLCLFCLIPVPGKAAYKETQAGNQMIFFPIGNGATQEFHFAFRAYEKRKENDYSYYYYRFQPISITDQEKGEWVSSFVDHSYNSGDKYLKVFAWGKLHGTPEESRKRFKILLGQEKLDLQFDAIKENRVARLICACAESGKSLIGIPAYKSWTTLNDNEIPTWEPLLAHLTNRFDGMRGRTGRNVDLYSVFTGISAIRETLQTDAGLQPNQSNAQRACMANVRVILGAVEMYNMDHSTMMEKLDLVALEKGKYLSGKPNCPEGGVYYGKDLTRNSVIRCPMHGDPENPVPDKIAFETNEKKMVKVADLQGPNAPSHPWRKMIKNRELVLPEAYKLVPYDCAFIHYPSYTAFRKSFDFFSDWAGSFGTMAEGDSADFSLEQRLKDQLLLKTDLMTRLFADLTISDIVLVCEDPFLFEGSAFAVLLKINNETLLNEKLAMTANHFQQENPSITKSQQTIAGKPVQVFSSPDFRFRSYRFSDKGFQVICNSPVLAEKILATIDRKHPSLIEFLDLHYFYEHVEKNLAIPGRIFAFLSDAFIRKILSPAYKISTKRRFDCMRNSILQTHELLLNGKLNPALECPEGGKYELVNNEIMCPVHRSFGRLTPVNERLPQTVTEEEANSYTEFVKNYNRYFTQFFDPIGFAFTTEPSFRGRLLIMPLVENGFYSELQKNVRRKAMNPGPRLKNGVLKIGANLRAESLPRPPGYWFTPGRNDLYENMKIWFTGCFWIHLADHPLLFQWESNMLARGILGSLGGGRSFDFGLVAPAVMSFFSPMLFALELNDARHYQGIIDWIERTIEANRDMSGGFSPYFSLDRMEEQGLEMYVLSLDLFALKKTFYFTMRDNFLIVASKKELLFELESAEKLEEGALLGNFNLVFYPEKIQMMKPDLLEQRARAQRKSCLANLKNLSFISTFRQDGRAGEFYRIMFGSAPVCPAGGVYSADMPISCSVHGTVVSGTLKPVPDFLSGIKAISIQSFLEPEGFQSEIQIQKK